MYIIVFLLSALIYDHTVLCYNDVNFVVQVPETLPPIHAKNTFQVYWNMPTHQCESKKQPLDSLVTSFGMLHNENRRHKGDKIVLLYDQENGLFPGIVKSRTSNRILFKNGVVPQEGDLDLHLKEFEKNLDEYIEDPDFNGIGVIDMELWRPIYRQLWGDTQVYRNLSNEVERILHPAWKSNARAIEAEAKRRLEEAGQTFMVRTLSLAKRLRPRALWGYYAYPYCYNMNQNKLEACSEQTKRDNDQLSELWSESTALFPSVYSSKSLTSSELRSLIKGRLDEASRVKISKHVIPFFSFIYTDGGFYSEDDLKTALDALYKNNATSIIVWGSSNDVSSVDKCKNLANYVTNVFGPIIKQYIESSLYEDVLKDINKTPTETDIVNFILNAVRNLNIQETMKNNNLFVKYNSTCMCLDSMADDNMELLKKLEMIEDEVQKLKRKILDNTEGITTFTDSTATYFNTATENYESSTNSEEYVPDIDKRRQHDDYDLSTPEIQTTQYVASTTDYNRSTPEIQTTQYVDSTTDYDRSTPEIQTTKYVDSTTDYNHNTPEMQTTQYVDSTTDYDRSTPEIQTTKYVDSTTDYNRSTPEIQATQYVASTTDYDRSTPEIQTTKYVDSTTDYNHNTPEMQTTQYVDSTTDYDRSTPEILTTKYVDSTTDYNRSTPEIQATQYVASTTDYDRSTPEIQTTKFVDSTTDYNRSTPDIQATQYVASITDYDRSTSEIQTTQYIESSTNNERSTTDINLPTNIADYLTTASSELLMTSDTDLSHSTDSSNLTSISNIDLNIYSYRTAQRTTDPKFSSDDMSHQNNFESSTILEEINTTVSYSTDSSTDY